MSATLLLDLGNTRLKWRIGEGGDGREGAVAWSEPVGDRLAEAWRSVAPAGSAFAGSVVDDERERRVAGQVEASFGLPVQWLRSPAEACGVRSAYAEPQRLGVDRFLSMVAARHAGLAPCILVGVGTALTLDALAADGTHLGGLIAPGPLLMQQALLGATARVRPEHAGEIVPAADNTADAVASGCWGACAALVERFAAQLAPRLGETAPLLFGGGDAQTLRSLVARPGELFGDGVLRGLEVWSRSVAPIRRAV